MKLDLRAVAKQIGKPSEKPKMTFDEIEERMNKINKRYSEILALPSKEFLSEPIRRELDDIHRETLYLAKELLRKE